jgi:hypothetical protein
MTVSAARERKIVAGTRLVVFVLLALGGLLAYHSAQSNAEAEQKADQFRAELVAHDLRAPSKEQVVRVLGDDGGALCDDPGSALKKGILYGQLTNGAGGPGQRPVIVDNKVVQGQLLAVKTYCPDELQQFTEVVDGLKYANVAKG